MKNRLLIISAFLGLLSSDMQALPPGETVARPRNLGDKSLFAGKPSSASSRAYDSIAYAANSVSEVASAAASKVKSMVIKKQENRKDVDVKAWKPDLDLTVGGNRENENVNANNENNLKQNGTEGVFKNGVKLELDANRVNFIQKTAELKFKDVHSAGEFHAWFMQVLASFMNSFPNLGFIDAFRQAAAVSSEASFNANTSLDPGINEINDAAATYDSLSVADKLTVNNTVNNEVSRLGKLMPGFSKSGPRIKSLENKVEAQEQKITDQSQQLSQLSEQIGTFVEIVNVLKASHESRQNNMPMSFAERNSHEISFQVDSLPLIGTQSSSLLVAHDSPLIIGETSRFNIASQVGNNVVQLRPGWKLDVNGKPYPPAPPARISVSSDAPVIPVLGAALNNASRAVPVLSARGWAKDLSGKIIVNENNTPQRPMRPVEVDLAAVHQLLQQEQEEAFQVKKH